MSTFTPEKLTDLLFCLPHWNLVVRHQKPPILPAFVHSLKEKAFSLEEIDAFDDEVSYVQGASSPNTPRRKNRAPSSSPSNATVGNQPEVSPFNSNTSPDPAAAGSQNHQHSRTSTSERTMTMSACVSDHVATNAQAGHLHEVGSESPANSSISASSVRLHNFEYAGGSRPGYWSSTESSRTLNQKLSEMRLATREEPSDSQCE